MCANWPSVMWCGAQFETEGVKFSEIWGFLGFKMTIQPGGNAPSRIGGISFLTSANPQTGQHQSKVKEKEQKDSNDPEGHDQTIWVVSASTSSRGPLRGC